MKRMKYLKCIGFLVVAITVFGAQADDSAVRTWTSNGGQTIDAAFVKVQYGKVHLRKSDDAIIQIGINQLSPEDQKVAKEYAAAMSKSSAKQLSSMGLKRSGDGTLSEEEVEKLKTSWTDEKTGKQYLFNASFGARKLDAKQKKKYKKSGKVPYRITASLYEHKESKGKKLSKRLKGTGRFYVLDSEGKVVLKKSMSLAKLCPS